MVFAAVDGETGRHVALRRFFPFGSDGGGLQPEERAAYDIGVKRLAEVVHPALRAVVTGGCDPVDGMPFLVTEWVEGSSLSKLLLQGSLTVESAIVLMDQALEVSELLSQVLAEDEVWVETAPSAIVVGGGESDRGITFWISPFRWLSTEETRPGLMPLVELLDEAMGWKAGSVSDNAGGGLGSWRNWLMANARKATLAEARAALVSSTKSGQVASSAPATARKVPPAKSAVAHRPMLTAKPQTSWVGKAVIAVLVLTALGLGGLLYYQKQQKKTEIAAAAVQPESPDKPRKAATPEKSTPQEKASTPEKAAVASAPEKPTPPSRPADEASRLAAANARAEELSSQKAKALEAQAQQTKAAEAKNGVFEPKDLELVALQKGKPVKIEGVLMGIGESNSKKTGYLRFTTDLNPKFVEGKFDKPTNDPGLQDEALKALVGKRIRLSGTVEVTQLNRVRRVQVDFPNRAAIEILP
ncbi:MAG: hypothetical protein CFE26_01045 [Verrucomicrobiales bacterium VVV1]|nr:MAG: hypothetical protein CFE26_01045 [Verrucomicrobiales bacterium VVV1]